MTQVPIYRSIRVVMQLRFELPSYFSSGGVLSTCLFNKIGLFRWRRNTSGESPARTDDKNQRQTDLISTLSSIHNEDNHNACVLPFAFLESLDILSLTQRSIKQFNVIIITS